MDRNRSWRMVSGWLILALALIVGLVALPLTKVSGAVCPGYAATASRNLTETELAACTCLQLEILRNEIYARHGRIFKRADLQQYFGAQPWYKANPNNPSGEGGQNQFERSNAAKVLNLEKARGCKEGSVPITAPCPVWPAPQLRYLTDAELAGCTCAQLELLRNEIFARHGRIFKRQDLQKYFSARPWYRPNPNNSTGEKGQNQFEKANAIKLKKVEDARGCK